MFHAAPVFGNQKYNHYCTRVGENFKAVENWRHFYCNVELIFVSG